jgi:hypothetical protein
MGMGFVPQPSLRYFVIKLMSPSDTLKTVQTKMQEYIDNGLLLSWLLNRKDRQVEIYRLEKTCRKPAIAHISLW